MLVVYADRVTRSETGDQGEEVERHIPFMKDYTVFNCEQVDACRRSSTPRAPSRLPSASRPRNGSPPTPGLGSVMLDGTGAGDRVVRSPANPSP